MADGGNRSMSFSEPRRAVSAPPQTDFNSVACGRLVKDGSSTAQCVIVSLSSDMSAALGISPPYSSLYGLLTCHHVLPTAPENSWKLILGPNAKEKHSLSRSKILKCLSCCGPNGFWQLDPHVPLQGNQMAGLCPARGDWTLAILQPAFVEDIKKGRDYFFPSIDPFTPERLKTAVDAKACRLFERKPDGTIVQHFLDINANISHPTEGRGQLENEVCSYRGMSLLRYPMTFLSTIKAGCSGAPIFCHSSSSGSLESLCLLGIHSSSPDLTQLPQSGDAEQQGVAVSYIQDSAIKDGAYCSLTACLAFVVETVQQNKCLPLSMEKLIKHLARLRQDLQRTCELNQCNQEAKKRDIKFCFELVDFVLEAFPESIRTMTYATLKHDNDTSLQYMKVLSNLFSCFEGYEASELGAAAEGNDGVKLPVVSHVEGVCKSLYSLMKSLKESDKSEDMKAVRIGFQLWWSLLHFNLVDGPVDCILNSSAGYSVLNAIRMQERCKDDACIHRMFGNISLAYQSKMRRDNDIRLSDLEKEQRLLITKMETTIERLKGDIAQHQEARTELEDQLREAKNEVAQCQNEKTQADETSTKGIKNLMGQVQEEKNRVCELQKQLEELKKDKCNVPQCTSLSASLGALQCTSLGDSLGTSLGASLGALQCTSLGASLGDSLSASLGACPTHQHCNSEASQRSSSAPPLSTQDFWSQDICDVLQARRPLCERIAGYFEKVKGAHDGSWEDLMKRMEVVLEKKELETMPMADILLAILRQKWRQSKMTVRQFCKISMAMGNSRVVEDFKVEAQRMGSHGDQENERGEETNVQAAKTQDHGKKAEVYQNGRPLKRVSPSDQIAGYESSEDGLALALRNKTADIVQYMNPVEISPHLFQEQLLTLDEYNHLLSLSETKRKNSYIFGKVCAQGRQGISLFIRSLQKSAGEVPFHKRLAEELSLS